MDWTRFPKQLSIWTVVCVVAAAPSFFLGGVVDGYSPANVLGMLLGIVAWVLAYASIGSTHWAVALRQKPFVLRTIKIGYGLRMVQTATFFFPVMLIPDLVGGMFSIWLTQMLMGGFDPNGNLFSGSSVNGTAPMVFLFSFLATVIQGTALNAVMAFILPVIWGVQKLCLKPPPPGDPTKICAECGYDLRASEIACPECGVPIPVKPCEPPAFVSAEEVSPPPQTA